MDNAKTKTTSEWKEHNAKNSRQLNFLSLMWTLSMALATFGPKFLWNFSGLLSLLAILLNLGLGIGLIVAFIRYLRGMDELQKKIQLEGLALAMGVGIIGGLSYSLLDISNLIAVDAEIGFVVILMSLTYLVSIFAGKIKYQ